MGAALNHNSPSDHNFGDQTRFSDQTKAAISQPKNNIRAPSARSSSHALESFRLCFSQRIP